MDDKPVKVLLIEDSLPDAGLVRNMLSAIDKVQFELEHVESLAEGLSSLSERSFDVILLDLSLPDGYGLDTVTSIRDASQGVPIVVMSGMSDQELAINAVHEGAQDYLVKGRVDGDLLVRSILYAMERKRGEKFREEYITLISHDLRNPLTIIQGHAHILLKSLELEGVGDLGRRNLEAIIASSQRINSMIGDLVESASLEAGHLPIEKQPVALAPFVFDLMERARGVMDVERVRLQVTPELPPIPADPVRLERILMNLLGNALKYSAAGSEVTVAAARSHEQVIVSVVDRGTGIAPADLPHVFERFYRARQAKKAAGLGLGLYIAKMLVEAHGGRIWAESPSGGRMGEGSAFHFTLPMAPQVTGCPAESGESAASPDLATDKRMEEN